MRHNRRTCAKLCRASGGELEQDPVAPWQCVRADDRAVPGYETGFGSCAERWYQAKSRRLAEIVGGEPAEVSNDIRLDCTQDPAPATKQQDAVALFRLARVGQAQATERFNREPRPEALFIDIVETGEYLRERQGDTAAVRGV